MSIDGCAWLAINTFSFAHLNANPLLEHAALEDVRTEQPQERSDDRRVLLGEVDSGRSLARRVGRVRDRSVAGAYILLIDQLHHRDYPCTSGFVNCRARRREGKNVVARGRDGSQNVTNKMSDICT